MNGNLISNLVSFTISDAAKQASDGAVQALLTNLKPTLISLNDDDRRSLPRVGPKADAMTAKALSYARADADLLPGFVDIDELQRDVDCVTTLLPYRQALYQLVEMMDDTIAQARAEAFAAGLAIYQSAKMGAKLNLPGAATVRDDLSVCFASPNRSRKVVTPTPAPSQAPTAGA